MKEIDSKGKLAVISGFSGAGKNELLKVLIDSYGFLKLVTYTDRDPRTGEIRNFHYYFISPEEMDRMDLAGELAEKPVDYGTSRKATSKAEIERIIAGENLAWIVESSLASKIANQEFFSSIFDEETANMLQERTVTIYLTADKNSLDRRRILRDDFDPEDFRLRDKHDQHYLEHNRSSFHIVIDNSDGLLDETIKQVVEILNLEAI